MQIKTDSREQRPYSFETDSVTGKLDTGDYSICGLENHVSIERKEINDLVGCLSQGRDRFERELFRARSREYFALVVEADLSDIAKGAYRSKMLPRAVLQSLMAFSIRYKMPIWFCGNRQYAERIT